MRCERMKVMNTGRRLKTLSVANVDPGHEHSTLAKPRDNQKTLSTDCIVRPGCFKHCEWAFPHFTLAPGTLIFTREDNIRKSLPTMWKDKGHCTLNIQRLLPPQLCAKERINHSTGPVLTKSFIGHMPQSKALILF
jgi:hypothetical protein